MESGGTRGEREDDDFSIMALASDLTVDVRPFLEQTRETQQVEEWFDCRTSLLDGDFYDLEQLQALRVEGLDKKGRPILRIVGKFFPGNVILVLSPSHLDSLPPLFGDCCAYVDRGDKLRRSNDFL